MNDKPERETNDEQRKRSRLISNQFWSIRSYLILLCWIVLSQSMISSGYIGSIVSSLERYYGFSTSRLGVAFSSYDVIGVISIPLVSYFGSQNNRPRIVAFGGLLFAFGNILFILPYLINGYEKESNRIGFVDEKQKSLSNENHLCQMNSSYPSRDSNYLCSSLSESILLHLNPNIIRNRFSNRFVSSQPSWTYYLLILSMIIMSIGASPFYTLGITFLTDHLNKDDQAICTSILYGMVALGPAIGFLMGSALLSQWINIGEKSKPDGLTTNDARWIGRWWPGFIVSSSFLILFSSLLCTFPSSLNKSTNQSNKQRDLTQSTESICAIGQAATRRHTLPKLTKAKTKQCQFICQGSKFKDILTSMVDLLMNLTYLLIVLINSVESILIVSFTTFMVKYMESVFNLSSSLSSTLTGSIVVPAAVLGTITGGYLVRRFHMGILQCSKVMLFACFLSWIGLFALVFLQCSPTKIDQGENQCSKMCHCSSNIYEPVCYQEEITYISPCHAGCSTLNGTDYFNCTCLSKMSQVRRGSCHNICLTETSLFLLILFLVTYFQTLMATPQLIIVLRSVQHELQSFALGFENCMIKILAQIPTPIIFGIMIDNQCLLWSQASCHRRGSCFIYNGKRLPLTLFGTAIVIKGLSLILVFTLFIVTFRQHRSTNKSTNQISQIEQIQEETINSSSL